jgi:16S rRNA (guanine(966)-N(2))-methyltransferase RsmD
MRIIAGKYRGRKLAEYFCDTTRPTTDRVKENVFNILSNSIDFCDCAVLDLFAGTGQYGIECMSRGAKFVVLNDSDKNALAVIRQNTKDIQGNFLISNKDYNEVLNFNNKFDLIFLDPPYNSVYGETAIDIIFERELLKPYGMIVFETDKVLPVNDKPRIIAVKKYGRTQVYFISRKISMIRPLLK